MLSDTLAVFLVTLISSLFLTSTYVHGLPTSPSILRYVRRHPSATDLSSTLRHRYQHPMPSFDDDLGGDASQMLIGKSNDLSYSRSHDDASALFFPSSFHEIQEQFDLYHDPKSSKQFSRKLSSPLRKQYQDQNGNEQQLERRASSPLNNTPFSLPPKFHFNLPSTAVATGMSSELSHTNNQSNEPTRLSPSLKNLVETNPFARVWLSLLLQKVMEEQPESSIFKYGRR